MNKSKSRDLDISRRKKKNDNTLNNIMVDLQWLIAMVDRNGPSCRGGAPARFLLFLLTTPTRGGAPGRLSLVLCGCGVEDRPRWVVTSGPHGTEWQRPWVTLTLWVMRRYNLGERSTVNQKCFGPKRAILLYRYPRTYLARLLFGYKKSQN